MIKKIDANEYGVVKYAITSVDELNRLPKKIAPSSQAILIENGLRVFVYGDGQWVEEVVDGDLSENMQSIVADYERSKIGYDGVKRGSLEERLKDDFQGIYDILNARDYCEYSGKELKVDNTWMGNQIDTRVEGRTLQNLWDIKNIEVDDYVSVDEKYVTVKANLDNDYVRSSITIDKILLKPKTKYTIITEVVENTFTSSNPDANFNANVAHAQASILDYAYRFRAGEIGIKVDLVTTRDEFTNGVYYGVRTFLNYAESGYVKYRCIILEGDYTSVPLSELPYFEGIESVGEREIGKNLLDVSQFTFRRFDSANEGDKITFMNVTNRLMNSAPIKVDINKKYSFSVVSNYQVLVNGVDNSTIAQRVEWCNSFTNVSFTSEDVYVTFRRVDENSLTEEDVLKIKNTAQLEESETATEYEPFGYKIKGKSCGKNLCVGEGDFYGYCDDTYNIYHAKNNTQPLSFNLKPNTTYTRIMYDCEFKGDYVYMFDSVKEIDGTYKQYPYFLRSAICVAAFTTGEKGGINEYVFNPESGTARTPGFFVKVGKLVILEGDYTQTPLEELPYEPYQESTYSIHSPIPLRSLPNGVCDVYDFESGAVIQKVGKVVLDGSENWLGYESYDDDVTKWFQVDGLIKANNRFLSCISDKFICVMSSTHTLTGVGEVLSISPTSNGRLNLRINKDKLSSLDVNGFKLWLQANPTTVYYELEEPIIHYLTPSQLKSFDGTTYVISENTLIPTTTTKILTNTYANVSNVNSTAYSLRRGVNNVAETSAIINETDIEQDDVLDVTMCAIDELYSMLEPNLE